MAVRFGSLARIGNRLPKSSNFWDGTAVYTPFIPTGSYESLAVYTVGSSGISTISFTGIPNTYAHLELRFINRSNRSGANSDVIRIDLNGSTSTDGHYLYGNGSSISAGQATGFIGWATGASATANNFAVGVLTFLDYASTVKNKTIRSLAGYDNNGSGEIALFSVLQSTLSATTSFAITSVNGASFQQYSQFALYGVKG